MAANLKRNMAEILAYVKGILEAEGDDFWPDDMLRSYINSEHDSICTDIHQAHEQFFTARSTAPLAPDEWYVLPDDFRAVRYMEYRVQAGQDEWREIRPLDRVGDRKDYALPDGISGGSGAYPHRYRGSDVRYAIVGNYINLVPFLNQTMDAGLRLWYDFHPAEPADDDWIPFGDGTKSLLSRHHEILAVGAAIRAKKTEEVQDIYGDWYGDLKGKLFKDIEDRQEQENKHGPDLEGYYA